MNKDIKNKISQLGEKYGATGQDLMSYLDGLLYADYLSYWDYIHLDTLLSLQNPKTDFPDEKIFITYHQITELYFKLIINELDQISNNGRHVLSSGEDLGWKKSLEIDFFIERLQRIIRYFENLVNSFDIMISGMDKKEFLKFRMALLPGSGFQSIQFRLIEIYSTDFKNLCVSKNNLISKENFLEKIYWQSGATEEKTKKKTYTLTQFNKKYQDILFSKINDLKSKNIYIKFNSLNPKDPKINILKSLLKRYDLMVNVHWKLAHYKSAIKYLKKEKGEVSATGGTNWKKYLPPKFQKIIFFPKIWSKKEKENWGINWVLENYK
tara:strand:- start:1208 stop:2179 length:972 start_codon:yes stop_codon:yes gene_type:complete